MSGSKGKKKIYAIAATATAAAAVIVLAVVLLLRAGGQESYRSIRIVELDGGVTIDREGVGNLEASVNMNLTSGDRISTSADSYVVLRLDDDKYMMLGEQGAIQVVASGDASNSRTEIYLESGSVLNEIQNPLSQDSSYEIITPNATMSVRGTVFETRNNVESGNMEVLVYEGNVAVALSDSEPVLYGPGEYTAFTSGDTPRFLEERGVITEEKIDSQMIERLHQINENGSTLNLGEANLAELIQQKNSVQGSQVADNSQLQDTDTSVPDTTPVPDNTSVPETASPSESTLPASPSASVKPVVTASPAASPEPTEEIQDSTPTPAATPAHTASPRPTEAPAPTKTPKPTEAPAPTETPAPTEAPTHTPSPTPGHYPDIDDEDVKTAWHEPENSRKNGVETEKGTMWKAIFYMPAISQSYNNQDNKLIAQINNQAPGVYHMQIVENGHLIPEPLKPTFNDASGAQDNFTFVGWYTEENKKWDFQTDKINSENVYLFPVWKAADGTFYYPIILRDADTRSYRCFSVAVGSHLYELPRISESGYNGYQNNNGQNREGYRLMAWEIENRPAERNAFWGIQTEKVSGVTSLRAVWGQVQTPAFSLILFTGDTKENGYGDLIDFKIVHAEQILEQGTLSAPARPFSSGLILPEEVNKIRNNPDAIDWQTDEGVSYSTITLEAGKIYIFHAVPK